MNRFALGVDLGGSKISYALLDKNGKVFHRLLEPTGAEEGADVVIDRMAAGIQKLIDESSAVVVGIGAAGMTDSRRGVVLFASNLKWKNVPLRQMLVDRLGPRWENLIWVDKDTNAAAIGEMYFGAGQGSEHLLYVTVGTGVGGGMILGGELYHGSTQGASDIGHMILQTQGPLCGCGHYGCLEALASGPAIARSAVESLNLFPNSVLYELEPDQISAQTVVEAAKKGDKLALLCLENAGKWLGIALAYYVNINNPDRIIVGGGVGSARDLLLDPARKMIAEQTLPKNAEAVRLFSAGLISDSGVIGAATLVWHHLRKG